MSTGVHNSSVIDSIALNGESHWVSLVALEERQWDDIEGWKQQFLEKLNAYVAYIATSLAVDHPETKGFDARIRLDCMHGLPISLLPFFSRIKFLLTSKKIEFSVYNLETKKPYDL